MTLNNEERTRCECWSRVMGYHRPTSAFNKGKQQEHLDRKMFTEGKATAPHNDLYPEVIAQSASPPTCKAAINYIAL